MFKEGVKMNLTPRQVAAKKTKQCIIKTATDLFMTNGYKQTSTREIANRCGITQPNLYHHFANKQVIYLAVIESLTDQVKIGMHDILQQQTSVKSRLVEMVVFLIEEHPTNLFGMLDDMSNEVDEQYHYQLYQLFQTTYQEPFRKLLSESDWEQPGDITLNEAVTFILYNVSALMSIDRRYHTESTREQVEKMVDMMLFGIVKKK